MLATLFSILLTAQSTGSIPSAPPPGPIPGQCAEPARDNQGRQGCYLAAELPVADPPEQIHWHLLRFTDEASARAEAMRHETSVVTFAHGQVWLHVLSADSERPAGAGEHVATAGPMRLAPGRPVIARFLEADFPPGMTTRTHSHPGPEAFYVLDGVQCVETNRERQMIGAGEVYTLGANVQHIQSSPTGRRNIALVFHAEGDPWMKLEPDWQPSGFCSTTGVTQGAGGGTVESP